jgi:hypothetical protein
MTSDSATWGASTLASAKAWAVNEQADAARAHAKIETIFAIVPFPVMRPKRARSDYTRDKEELDVFAGLFIGLILWLISPGLPIVAICSFLLVLENLGFYDLCRT